MNTKSTLLQPFGLGKITQATEEILHYFKDLIEAKVSHAGSRVVFKSLFNELEKVLSSLLKCASQNDDADEQKIRRLITLRAKEMSEEGLTEQELEEKAELEDYEKRSSKNFYEGV